MEEQGLWATPGIVCGANKVSNNFFKKSITKLLLFQIFLLLFFIIADKICYVETERQNFLATNTRQHNNI